MAERDQAGTETALSARESLDLIDRQRATVSREFSQVTVVINAMWSVLWFAWFLAFHLAGNGWPGPLFPAGVAAGVTIGAIAVGVVVSTVLGVRSGRGRRGPSMTTGAMYGWTWSLSFCALAGVNLSIMRLNLSPEAVAALWAGSSMLLAGALSMAGGAIWRDTAQYVLGIWLLLVGVACVLAGIDYEALVLAFGGLIGFGGRAVVAWRKR